MGILSRLLAGESERREALKKFDEENKAARAADDSKLQSKPILPNPPKIFQRIKAIETRYKGYRFRSRTEARWAVFFDAFGVNRWDYEKEGFVLPSRSYLPDFWIEWGWCGWVEVKGTQPSENSIDCRLCQELAFSTKQEVVLVSGIPSQDELYHFFPDGWRFGSLVDIFGARDRIEYAIEIAKSARFEFSERNP